MADSQLVRDSLLPSHQDSTFELRIGAGRTAVNFHQHNLAIDGALGLDFLKRGLVALDLRRLPK